MKTITAIIPVRAGSTRLKNKNVAPFAGTNLLINKINQLKNEIIELKKNTYNKDEMLLIIQIEGLKSEKRMIQSTDRKILDVNRQNEIDKEIKNLELKFK